MKTAPRIHPLSLCFLLAGVFPGATSRADTTLVYGDIRPALVEPDQEKVEQPAKRDREKVLSAQRIYLRENGLALETYGESRVMQFDRDTGAVRLVDHDKKVYMDLDEVMIAQLAERLTETQRKVLDGFEERVSNMPKKDRERLRKVLDELHAATDDQLEKTPEVRYQDRTETEKFGELEASVVDTYVGSHFQARYFVVDREELDISDAEYETLTEFQKAIVRFSRRLPGALRLRFGNIGMLARSGKIPVHVMPNDVAEEVIFRRLLNHFDDKIDPGWFEVPEDYRQVILRPGPLRPGKSRP